MICSSVPSQIKTPHFNTIMTLLLPTPAFLEERRSNRADSIAARKKKAERPLVALPEPETPVFEPQILIHPEHSLSAFRTYASHRHVHVDDLTADEAFQLMLGFYRDVMVPECSDVKDADMLLCEWGLYDCGGTDLYHFEISRQFTECDTDDDTGVSRLTIGLHFKPTFTLRAIPAGELICQGGEDLASFEQAVRSSDAFWAVATLSPAEVALEWEPQ